MEAIRVNIEMTDGDIIPILIRPYESTYLLKELIQVYTGIPVEAQELVFNGTPMKPYSLLRLGVKNDDTVLLRSKSASVNDTTVNGSSDGVPPFNQSSNCCNNTGESTHEQVFVKHTNGRISLLPLIPNETVGEFKKRIGEGLSLLPDQMRLLFEGRMMYSGKTLSEHEVRKDSTVEIHEQQCGC